MILGLTLHKDTDRCLQEQLRSALLDAIHSGSLPDNEALPSCRKLSKQLGVSRNTVAIVYETLADDGYIISRPRSGYYLHPDYHFDHSSEKASHRPPQSSSCQNRTRHHINANTTDHAPLWNARLKQRPSHFEGVLKPSNWHAYPYSFIYGQLDPQQFPLSQWRGITRRLLGATREKSWLNDCIDQDDPLLIEQLRQRVLPRRGIFAREDEILITLGSQNALFLLSQLLLDSHSHVGMENPGYKEAANIFQHCGAQLVFHDIDREGMVIDQRSSRCDYLYVTPSHQVPTGVRMTLARRRALEAQVMRHDQVILEDDYDAELHGDKQALPAMKAGSVGHRVIYFSSLSKAFAPGLRLGYVVADAELINEMRALRRLMYRHPPANIQHQVAQFIAQGYYEKYLRTHIDDTDRRRDILREALQRHIPDLACCSHSRASAFWMSATPDIDTQRLAWQASQQGVLIEPGFQHFFDAAPPRHFLRLGFQAIAQRQIVPGITTLAKVLAR